MAIDAATKSVLVAVGIAASTAALSAAPNPLPTLEGVTQPAAPRAIADFELTDQDGRPMRFSSLLGQPALVLFGFAHCPDVCPATLQKLKLLKDSVNGEFHDVPVVMISVDGDRDTPQSMKTFLAGFSSEFVGLTGDPRKVRDIAAQFPAVFFKGLPARAGEGYLVEHSFQVYAVDSAGRVRAEMASASIKDMATVTRSLVAEK